MNEKNNEKLVSSREIARIVGKTERSIQLLAKEGTITCQKKGQKNVYDLYKVIQEYIDYMTKKETREFSSLEEEKLNEEIKLKRAKAEMAELELKELKGTLHAAEDVEAMTTDLCLVIRSALLSLPGRLAVDIVEMETVAEASAMIKNEVCQVLEELSQYEYNPDEYKKRVRERQGWKEDADESDT